MNIYWLTLAVLLEGSMLLFVIRTTQQRTPIALSCTAAQTLRHAESQQRRIRSIA